MLQKIWYDQPVRTQLLVAVAGINLLAALIAGAVSILNTRTATQVEMEASLEVAQRFVAVTVKDLAAQGKLDQLSQELPAQLNSLMTKSLFSQTVLMARVMTRIAAFSSLSVTIATARATSA